MKVILLNDYLDYKKGEVIEMPDPRAKRLINNDKVKQYEPKTVKKPENPKLKTKEVIGTRNAGKNKGK